MSAYPEADREQPYLDAERRYRTRQSSNEREGAVWANVLDHLRPVAMKAGMSASERGEYDDLLDDTARLLREIAIALGWKGENDNEAFSLKGFFSLRGLWKHACDRELQGWERCRIDWSSLIAAYTKYKQRTEWQTAYLDWVFIDAFLYKVLYDLIDNLHNDVLMPGDTGRWLPSVQSAFVHSSDDEKKHPLLLEVTRTFQLAAFRWLPTALILAIGVGCFYVGWVPWFFHQHRPTAEIGNGWPTAGWTILGLLAAWRAYRFVRWLARIPRRQRAWKAVNRLADGYHLLGSRAISTPELRRAIEGARELFGRSAVLGGDFWAVLDDVCARHPITLIPWLPLPGPY